MTNEQMKQRYLELGYEEREINSILFQAGVFGRFAKNPDNFFAKLFGSKYDDEEALRNLIENWNLVDVFEVFEADRTEHPEDYYEIDSGKLTDEEIKDRLAFTCPPRTFNYASKIKKIIKDAFEEVLKEGLSH